jgi:hypothetical protein
MQIFADNAQHPHNSTRTKNILSTVQLSSFDATATEAALPTTLEGFTKAVAKDSGAQNPHKNSKQPHVKSLSSKNRGVLEGGHVNFVRLAAKKGKTSFTYKSKSGSSNKNVKNRKWATRKMVAESLPVAGLGADSTKEAHLVC